ENTTFAGATAGTGSLTKTGSGILTLLPLITSTTTAASTSSSTVTLNSTALAVGMPVTGPGIPAGATIATVPNTTSVTLSVPVTLVNGAALSFGSGYTGATNLNGGLANIANVLSFGLGTAINFDGGGVQWNPNTNIFSSFSPDISTRTVTFGAGGATFDTNNNQIALANSVGNGGTGGVTKAGNGTLFLQGANNYTGATTVRNGTLRLENAQALGTGTAGVTVQSGATLALAGGNSFGTQTLSLNGNGSVAGQSGAFVNALGANSYMGPVVLGSAATISVDAGSLLLSSGTALSGTGDLTLTGSGAGTLSDNLAFTGGLNKTGTGTWTLSGTGGTYTGATSITGGALSIVGGALAANTATTLGGGTLTLTTGNQTIGAVTIASNTNNFVVVGSGAALTTGATFTRGVAGTVAFDTSAGGTLPTSVTGGLLGYATVTDGTGSGTALVSGGNIIRFTAAGATTLTSTSNGAGTDFTTLSNSGTLAWDNGTPLVNFNRSVNSLTFDATGNSGQTTHMGMASNVLTLTSGVIQVFGSGNATLLGGQVGANNSEVFAHQDGTGTFAINSPISSGTGSLIKFGAGTLQVSGGVSTATGTLNSSTTVTVGSTAGLAVGQAVTGFGLPVGATIAAIPNGTTITLSSAATVTTQTVPSQLTFGTGSTYTGPTIVNGGILQAGSSSRFSLGTVTDSVAALPTSIGGPFGIGSAVSLANVAGAGLDVNGYTVTIGSLSGGGAAGGNLLLSNGGTLQVGGNNFLNNSSQITNRTSFGGLISGDGNLTLTGGGLLALTNNNSTFSGQVNINSGTLVISNMGQLGTGTSPIFVNGVNSTVGIPSGTLVVQGGLSGLTFNRDLSLASRGNNNAIGLSLLNIGNNSYTGVISTSTNAGETRVGSSFGTMTITSSGVLSSGGASQGFHITGGPGNVIIDGLVIGGAAGVAGINKSSRGGINNTLVLSNINNNYVGDIRADSGSIRISDARQLGIGTSASVIRGSTGTWEFRTAAPTGFASKNVSLVDNTSGVLTLLVDRAIGGSGINQTVTFGTLSGVPANAANEALTIIGRNGYGASFSSFNPLGNSAQIASLGITNSGSGLVTVNGDIWKTTENAGLRTFTLTASGETVVTGSIINPADRGHLVVKAGTGTASVLGSASNFRGATSVNAGTLIINSFGGLNNAVTGSG
ncbi:MAG: hypothetical protein JWO89_3843, partial [Verrucomicrobiaceae bacterium]|nr:hypothetical protein [Verrucomicrobiaceae bacterium]